MKEIVWEAVVENIPRITAFVDEELEKLGCSMKAQVQIDVAIDEIFSNIAFYAYDPGKGDATVRFDYDEQTKMAELTFIDSGMPFDPLAQGDPDTTLPAAEREVGGLGIFMIRKTMDEVQYRREEGLNILTIRKRIR